MIPGAPASVRVVATATLLLAIAGGVRADEGADAAYRRAREALVPQLREFAAWCESRKLYSDRNRSCESILAIEPDDAAARKALQWTRGKDGKWQRTAVMPPPSPTDPAFADEVAARREGLIGPYRAAAFALIRERTAPPASRERALDELIGVEPQNEEARAANRETLVKGRWLLEETVAAKTRRKSLLGAVEAARKSQPEPGKAAPTADELAVWNPWTDVRDIGRCRVLAGPRVTDAEEVARAAGLVLATHETVLGRAAPQSAHLRVYLFDSHDDSAAARARDKRLSDEDRRYAKGLASYTVPRTDDAYITGRPRSRVEWTVRKLLVDCLWREFKVGAKPVWAREGLCHWYSEILLGTHFCYFIRRTEYAGQDKQKDGLHDRLFSAVPDWLPEARALDQDDRWPDLRVALGCDASTMTADQALAAYVLCRYLVEGRASHAAGALAALGNAKSPDDWAASALDCSVEGLDRRLRRWVRESE